MATSPLAAHRSRALLTLVLASAVATVTPAAAQAPAPGAFPRMVAPAADSVLMRSGAGAAWYPIATIKAGSALKADAEIEGWLRVEYLPGMHAVVKADEAELKPAEGKVVLSKRSRLRALSQADAVFEESFKAVFEEFLAPGLEMNYVGPIKDRTGTVAGYIVTPPAGAKGYVSAREMRDAKPGETSKPVEPSRPIVTSQTASAPVTAQPAPPPAQPASTATPAAEPASITPVETPTTAPIQPSAPPPRPTGPSIRQLDRAFDELMAKPLTDADPQELIEQYHRYADTLAASTPGADRTVKYCDTRVQLLKIRQRARDLLPEIMALEDASRNAASNYRMTIDRLITNREYKVAGRLYPSTVYDGDRLPRMYRLVSIDPGVKSTLAYLIPVPEHQLEQKVGAVVGVLGEGTVEPSAMVEIITPTVVDVLRAADEPAPAAP
jgi:uncharacterized protein YraI